VSFDLIIRNGIVVTGERIESADIGIRDGKIVDLGDLKQASTAEVLDAKGLHVLPGVIDTQVHFREPGLTHKEDLETGTKAAILGGVTTIFDEPNTSPTTTAEEALRDKLERAKGRAWCDYAFWVGASKENLDQLAHLDTLEGSPGIGEVFMGSSTGPLLVDSDEDLRKVLQNGTRRVSVHAEDEARNLDRRARWNAGNLEEDPTLGYPLTGTVADHPHIRDSESARLATRRILKLAEETGRPIHILHLSTAEEVLEIEAARLRGVDVTVEITPQHLWFAAPGCYERLGALAQMNPPIRSGYHRAALRDAFQKGFFNVIGSDHAPHTREEKSKAYPHTPSGMTGVQTLLPVMLTLVKQGFTDLRTVVRMKSEQPARIFSAKGKGRIAPGYDADLVLLDPNQAFVVDEAWLASRCGWSPFAGETLYGRPENVILRGQVAARAGQPWGLASGNPVFFNQ